MRAQRLVTRTATAIGTVAVGVATLAATVVVAPGALAAPAPVGGLTVTDLTDHHIWVHFDTPADPTTVVSRLTRGYTPAATPGAGYAVPVANHIVQPGSTGAPLTADTVYTIAFWVKQGSAYSARRTVTTRTLNDTHRPDDLEIPWAPAPSVNARGEAQVQLVWDAVDVEEDFLGTRIVRNTAPTTTGGTVFFVPAPQHTFLDVAPPMNADITGPQPVVHYWVISEDRSGNFSPHYKRLDVVVANKTLRGHVAAGQTLLTNVLCCPADGDVYIHRIYTGYDAIALAPGDFTIHVPPGVYGLCGERLSSSAPPLCYAQHPDGTLYTYPGTSTEDGDVPLPTLNLVTNTSLSGLDF